MPLRYEPIQGSSLHGSYDWFAFTLLSSVCIKVAKTSGIINSKGSSSRSTFTHKNFVKKFGRAFMLGVAFGAFFLCTHTLSHTLSEAAHMSPDWNSGMMYSPYLIFYLGPLFSLILTEHTYLHAICLFLIYSCLLIAVVPGISMCLIWRTPVKIDSYQCFWISSETV